MSTPSYLKRDRRVRLKTWPLAAFLGGFLLTPGNRPGSEQLSVDKVLGASFFFGCTLAAIAFVVAAILNRWLEPTKSALPFSRDRPVQTVIFAFCFVASTALKASAFLPGLGLILGVAAIVIVVRGRAWAELRN